MTPTALQQRLNAGRLNKGQIEELVQDLTQYPELLETLLSEVFAQDFTGVSFNASWVFDHLMRKKLEYLLPHIDLFIEGSSALKTESCMRPMAHVMELLNEAYFHKRDTRYSNAISPNHQEQMITICFDWLIGNHKVATKVFAMTSLYLLGEKHDWVRPELKSIIERQIPQGTAGFRSRGGKILANLKNLGY